MVTAFAAGASVLVLSVTAVVLWPRTYGAEAALVLDGNAHVDNPVKLASRIEAALLEREVLASAAMDLPPELRSPDPIGKLRAGIRVQARGPLGYAVEFRGSDPHSVQRIANRLVDRAVTLVPKLATSPDDAAPLIELAAKTRAVTEFLTAHPEMTLEQAGQAGPSPKPQAADRGLDLLRTEKRQIEQRLATGASDNPYADPGDDPDVLTRRLTEVKLTIARREAALRQPLPEKAPAGATDLAPQWRALLAQLADAQAKASRPETKPPVSAHVSARATLPKSPLTPNRLVLSIVAGLLSVAAAMLAFVLPRRGLPTRVVVGATQPLPRRSDPPLGTVTEPLRALGPAPTVRALPPRAPAEPGHSGSEPARAAHESAEPARRESTRPSNGAPAGASQPPGPMAPLRTVVVTSPTQSSPPVTTSSTQSSPPRAEPVPRRRTSPGGVAAPTPAQLHTPISPAAKGGATAPPAAQSHGSRPPPGAGSYSVSSSLPPPVDGGNPVGRTTVERLSPLQAQRPAATQQTSAHSTPPTADHPVNKPQITSRPPALDPEAERWAAHFEVPPPGPEPEGDGGAARVAPGRWKTQAMGSMVPLDVQAARDGRRPRSDPPIYDAQVVPLRQANAPAATTLVHHDLVGVFRPSVDSAEPSILALRDAILRQGLSRHLRVAVTGRPGADRATTAGALAIALSEAGAKVLLLEADFDQPRVQRALSVSVPSGAGFSQQIIARRQGASLPWAVLRCTPTLHVLAEGRVRSPGLLDSLDFARAIAELGEQHHVLIIHAPSLERPTDLRTVDRLAQSVVLVDAKRDPTIEFGDNPIRALL
jgi:Mrp family chromosome partitioning ATPase